MKTRFILAAFTSFLHFLCIAHADTLVTVDGESIEGRIVREDDKHYVLEIEVSETIRDERIILKSDVRSVEREGPDIVAFKEIEDLVPTPDLLGVEDYEARIEKLEGFIVDYPNSGKAERAKEMLDVLNSELQIVSHGGIKHEGELVPAEAYDANAYEYDATIAAMKINEAINRRDFLSALRLFSAYDETFADASSREDLVVKIKEVLTAFGRTLEASLASFDSRVEKRQLGLERMSGEDRAQTERALEEEMTRLQARFEKEKADGAWVTPDSYHKASLEEARRQVEKEMKRLESKGSKREEAEAPLAEVYRETWSKLGRGTDEEKKGLIEEAARQRMPEAYLEKLRARAGVTED